MAITEQARAAHRERVAQLRSQFGEPNAALDAFIREHFSLESLVRVAREYANEVPSDEAYPAKADVLEFMRDHESGGDRESVHKMVDDLLLGLIDDVEIAEAFGKMRLWYA